MTLGDPHSHFSGKERPRQTSKMNNPSSGVHPTPLGEGCLYELGGPDRQEGGFAPINTQGNGCYSAEEVAEARTSVSLFRQETYPGEPFSTPYDLQ